jgi:hypothetical protein
MLVTSLIEGADALRRRRYGVIEVSDGQFRQVKLRWFPKVATGLELLWFGQWQHRHCARDRIHFYYNQPWRFPNFLTLKYSVSGRHTSMKSLCRGLDVLDEIARLKGSDAILCDVSNWRISTRLMARWGWVPHCPSRWHRHFIKRFYGDYPAPAAWLSSPINPRPNLASEVPIDARPAWL